MGRNIVYVRIDVDEVRYHGCALNLGTVEILDEDALFSISDDPAM